MKIFKKLFTAFIISILIYTLINIKMMKTTYASSEKTFGNIHLCLDNPDNIIFDYIEVEMYSTSPIIEGNKIVRYEHTLYDTIFLTNRGINIAKPSECVLFKIVLKKLPNDTGVLNKTIFIQEDESLCEIKLRKIFNVEISSDEKGNRYPVLTSKYDEKIYADYNIEIDNNMDNTELTMSKDVNYFTQLNNNVNQTENIPDNNLISYSYYPVNYQSNNNRFYVQYDSSTMIEDNAMLVYNTINEIADYFGSFNAFESVLPETSDNKFLIQLQPKSYFLDGNNYIDGETISTKNNDGSVTSWISLQYDLLTSSDSTFNNYYIYVLAHEYFHALIAEISNFDNSIEFQYLNESFAAFAGILFMSDKGLQCEKLKIEYMEYAQNFIRSNELGFSNYNNSTFNQYSGFLFPLYLYKKYGMGIIKNVIEEYISGDYIQNLYHYVLCSYKTTFRKAFIDFSNLILFADVNFNDVIIPYYLSSWYVIPVDSTHDQFANGSYSQCNIEIQNYSNLLLSNKVDVCNNIKMLCTIELENRNNSIIIYGTKDANNTIDAYQMNVESDLITIPCNDYCTPSKKEWRCFVNSNSTSEDNTVVSYTVQFKHSAQSLYTGSVKDASLHFHKNFNEVLYEFLAHSTKVYEITIDTINEYNVSPNGMVFTLYDANNNVITSTNGTNSCDFKTSIHLYCNMKVNQKYYLRITYLSNQAEYYTKCLISINNFDNSVTLNDQTEYIYNDNVLKQLNNGIYIHSTLTQTYNINLTFHDINNNSFDCSLYVLIGYDLILIKQENIRIDNNSFYYKGTINKNYKYYIFINEVPKTNQNIKYDLNIYV